MDLERLHASLPRRTRAAVAHYWKARSHQLASGKGNQSLRGAVTGGAQMDGFINLFTKLLIEAGMPEHFIFRKKALELPGFFRPTKEWDLLVVREKTLLAALEVKSQVGPSFGNNFNNRTEEAMGSALDLWTAYRERAFLDSPQPFVGYLFMLEDCSASNRPVRVREPHFAVREEFTDASYMKRYELFCRKLVLERHYSSAALVSSAQKDGIRGHFTTPAKDLSIDQFARSLIAHITPYV